MLDSRRRVGHPAKKSSERTQMPVHYLYLFLAIAAETVGTTALQASQQFTRAGPSVLVVAAYALSFYFMSFALKAMPVGIVYAIWSGLGIVFIAALGFVIFGQRLDLPAVLGMGLIIAGILVIHLFSATSGH
ncbi:small multidrug resistance pump [Jhaorihella thermophila]|uniref:Small multidrug resistance pump n=2 Tax=Jhaorihella thermophila TaxID=488547 RepID=A0A1H5SD84_9RHOB|nr:small multidrug resistance pump [Jhaorihella thermophila]